MLRSSLKSRKSPTRLAIGQRCPQCKLGQLAAAGSVMVFVAPGWEWPVAGCHLRCDHCDATMPRSAQDRRKADELAYAQHRQMILERDGNLCQREREGRVCGRRAFEVHHIASRAQNPGATKHSPENLQAVCSECHREHHG